MTLREQIASDMQTVFFNTSDFAVTGTYKTSSTDSGTSVTVIIFPSQSLSFMSPGQAASYRVMVPVADIANPRIHQTITVGATVYTIEQIQGGSEHLWTLECSADHRVSL